MEESRLIAVGKIVRTHGVKGAVKVFPYGETLALQTKGDRLHLIVGGKVHEDALTLMASRHQGKLRIMSFQEILSVDEAEKIVGLEVFLPEERLPPASEGEYYHYQLIGLDVVTKQGELVGTFRGIIETGVNDIYSIDRNGQELLVPAVEEFICEVDLERNRMVIDPPEGLMNDL